MAEYSPHEIASNLQDYLATHDKPLVFLFGAGTSAAIRVEGQGGKEKPLVPPIGRLTQICEAAVGKLGDGEKAAWGALCLECESIGERANVESVLSRVRAKVSAMGGTDQSCGLDRAQLSTIERTITETIINEASPSETLIPKKCPHDTFARWIARTSRRAPIEIFTTNYDVLFERALENARVPIFDGFIGSHQPFFAPEVVEDNELMPPADWVRLWKLHGSINWSLSERQGSPRVVRSGGSDPQLILPSQLKYTESRKEPYLALTDRLSRALRRDGTILVSVGFAFGDQHLNNIIFDALDSNPLTHLFCLSFEDLDAKSDLSDRARRTKNVLVVARDGAIVGGQTGTWSPQGATTVFTGDGEADKKGEMELGDFAVFVKFLSEMDPSVAFQDEPT